MPASAPFPVEAERRAFSTVGHRVHSKGLEDVFWVEGAEGKWMARKKPTMSVEDLVRERTSPAVKLALRSLVEATAATDAGKKPRKGKAQCLKPSI